jgi:hypothetical protein
MPEESASTLNWKGYSYEPAAKVYEGAGDPFCITPGVGKTVATLYNICILDQPMLSSLQSTGRWHISHPPLTL